MGLGKMRGRAVIKEVVISTDSEGFESTQESVVMETRAYREGRHGSSRWANLAAFSDCTDLFRFRKVPGISVTTDNFLEYEGERFYILSVENIKGKGMYLEVLAKKVVSSVG